MLRRIIDNSNREATDLWARKSEELNESLVYLSQQNLINFIIVFDRNIL